jgi:hypothetical protein
VKWSPILAIVVAIGVVIASALLLGHYFFSKSAGTTTTSPVAGAAARTPYCSAVLKVLSTDASNVVNSLQTKINEEPQRPLSGSMKSRRSMLVVDVDSAIANSPNQADKSALNGYLRKLKDSRTPLTLITVVWAFDGKRPLAVTKACRGQYKYLVSPIAPFGPAS